MVWYPGFLSSWYQFWWANDDYLWYYYCCSFSVFIGVTLSELSSVYPNAAAQIYWAQNWHPKYARACAYFTGILLAAGSTFTTASVNMTSATAIVGMYMLHHPEKQLKDGKCLLFMRLSQYC